MRVIIDETVAALELAHSLCRTEDDPDAAQQGPNDLVLWTDASAAAQNQAGASGLAIVYRHDNKPTSAWKEVSLGVLGQKKIHQAELLAIIYALRIALRVCKKKRAEADAAALLLPHKDEEDPKHLQPEDTPEDGPDPTPSPKKGTVTILSDCQGALMAIIKGRTANLTRLVRLCIAELVSCGFTVDFRWVPAHRVIGNVMADKLAVRTRLLLARTLLHVSKKALKKMGWRELPCRRPGTGIEAAAMAPVFLVWPASNTNMVLGVTPELGELLAMIWKKRLKPLAFTLVETLS